MSLLRGRFKFRAVLANVHRERCFLVNDVVGLVEGLQHLAHPSGTCVYLVLLKTSSVL